jgi:lysophospholipase L1-like esterase
MFLIFHLVLLYFGIASPFTTLSVYGFLTWIAVKILRWMTRKGEASELAKNIRLAVFSTLIALFAGEMALRFVIKSELSYGEKNGGWFYVSPYRIVLLENVMRKYYLGEEDVTLRVRQAGLKKRSVKTEFDFLHEYNNEGLRDADFDLEKRENEYRVLTFGDSFTEGVGTPGDSTWPRLLKRHLQGKMPQKEVVSMNFGASGSDVVFECDKLKKIGLKYRPDLVILTINNTDLNDLVVRGGRERFQDNQTLRYHSAPAAEYLYAFSYIFRQVRRLNSNRNHFLISSDQYTAWLQDARKSILYELDQFQKLADEHNFTFCAVFHPLPHEIQQPNLEFQDIYAGLTLHPPHHKVNILEYWQQNGTLKPEIAGKWYWKLDRHHTPTGYQALADAIAASLPDSLFPTDSISIDIGAGIRNEEFGTRNETRR